MSSFMDAVLELTKSSTPQILGRTSLRRLNNKQQRQRHSATVKVKAQSPRLLLGLPVM